MFDYLSLEACAADMLRELRAAADQARLVRLSTQRPPNSGAAIVRVVSACLMALGVRAAT